MDTEGEDRGQAGANVPGPTVRRASGEGFRGRGPYMAAVGAVAAAALALGGVAVLRSPGTRPAATPPHGRAPGGVVLAAAKATPLAPGATISVTGSGSVEGTPDTVSFSIGVHTSAGSATSALEANNAQVQRLMGILGHHGVVASDMLTSSLAIYDNTNSGGAVTGFSVDDQLDVRMTDIGAVGGAIDSAAQAVGNGITLSGISFSISNQSHLLARARAAAMASASTEATQVARGAGLQLGPIVKVTDEENSSSGPIYPAYAATASGSSVPVAPGRQPISVQVSVVYQLKA